jgi:hypothetical protein
MLTGQHDMDYFCISMGVLVLAFLLARSVDWISFAKARIGLFIPAGIQDLVLKIWDGGWRVHAVQGIPGIYCELYCTAVMSRIVCSI